MSTPAAFAQSLQWIDETHRGSHWLLEPDDHCLFLGDYFPGKGRAGGPMNGLIIDFKRAPSSLRASASAQSVQELKEHAIVTVAGALRRGFGQPAIESLLTFVPMPTSRTPGDVDYCDRLLRTLQMAFRGGHADIRPLLRLRTTVAPDHGLAAGRMPRRELSRLMKVDPAQLGTPLRPIVVLFDDVLVSGKHFSVAKEHIHEHRPEQMVVGVFVARAARTRVA